MRGTLGPNISEKERSERSVPEAYSELNPVSPPKMMRRLYDDPGYDSNGTESARDFDDDADVSSDEWDSEIPVPFQRREDNRDERLSTHAPVRAIERLPPELLSTVLAHIDDKRDQWSFLMTCRAWFFSAVDSIWFRPVLNDETTLSLFLRTLVTPQNQLTLDYGAMVRRLNFTNVAQLLTDRMLLCALGCRQLERLTLTGCSQLSDRSVVPMISQNCGLQSVDITNIEMLTNAVIETIASNCHQIQGLYVANCSKVTDGSLSRLAHSCPLLKRVKLNGCFEVTDTAVADLIRNCRMLVELDLAGCPNTTNTVARLAMLQLPHLREFRLSGSSNLSDEAFLGLANAGTLDKLRIIDLTSCVLITDSTVGNIVRAAPRLRNVVLAKCANITDRGLQYLTLLGRSLHYLHLGHCSNITDHGINQLVKYCVRLQYIDMACCTQLTDAAVHDLATLPRLRRIGLVKCLNITDSAIYSLIEHAGPDSALERVHLSYCGNITLTAILHLVNACDKLTHLSLTGVPPFMRHDLTRFCRPPPPDFTQHQQAMFCVFSGSGVDQLRKYLNQLVEEQARLSDGVSLIGNHATVNFPAYRPPIDATSARREIPMVPLVHSPPFRLPRVALDEGEDRNGDDDGFTTE